MRVTISSFELLQVLLLLRAQDSEPCCGLAWQRRYYFAPLFFSLHLPVIETAANQRMRRSPPILAGSRGFLLIRARVFQGDLIDGCSGHLVPLEFWPVACHCRAQRTDQVERFFAAARTH